MLVLAPAACCLGGIAISSGLTVFSRSSKSSISEDADTVEATTAPRRKSKRCVYIKNP